MAANLEQLIEKILAMTPAKQFLLVSELFAVPGKEDIAWAIAKRVCDEHDAAVLFGRRV